MQSVFLRCFRGTASGVAWESCLVPYCTLPTRRDLLWAGLTSSLLSQECSRSCHLKAFSVSLMYYLSSFLCGVFCEAGNLWWRCHDQSLSVRKFHYRDLTVWSVQRLWTIAWISDRQGFKCISVLHPLWRESYTFIFILPALAFILLQPACQASAAVSLKCYKNIITKLTWQ